MTTAQRGFKGWCLQTIPTRPGHTSEEYARIYLAEYPDGSNSQDPVFSLKTTLEKEYREGRMPGIKKVDRKFYQTDQATEIESRRQDGLRVQLTLPQDVAVLVGDLVEVEKFRSATDAVDWLVREGVKANQTPLARVHAELQEIRRRKESARSLL